MASITKTGCQVNLNSNETGKIVTTFLSGQAGIKVTSIKFENDSGASIYLTPNGASGNRHFYIDIRGVNPSNGNVNNSIRMADVDINAHKGQGYPNALGNNGVLSTPSANVNTVLTGNIQLCVFISAAVGASTGFVGGASKVTLNYETRPTVSAGTVITKTQMDNLRAFLGNSPTAVTQNTVATAAVGNTYKSGLTAGTTPMTAAWYNSAGT